jgi:hypothetical protein
VSGRDAFENEMGFGDRIGSGDAERLLSNPALNGDGPAEPYEVGAFVHALPAAVATRPDPDLAAAIVSRAAMAARAASLEAHAVTTPMKMPHTAWPWRRRVAVAALAIALLPVAMAGLALAGVTLPEPAREAFDRVGIDLPNQPEADARSPAGTDATGDEDEASTARNERGAKSGGDASGASRGQARQPGDGGDASEHGRGHSWSGGPESTPPGHGATPPGQGGVPPGQGAPPPGHEATPPDQESVPPDQESVPPDQESVPPDRKPITPGHGGVPPGHGGVPPGQAKQK